MLSKIEKWHLRKEGIEARVRNKLGSILSILQLMNLYSNELEVTKKQLIFNLIKHEYGIAFKSYEIIILLSRQVENFFLEQETEKLKPIFNLLKKFVNEAEENKKSKILSKFKKDNNVIIDKIISTCF